MTSVRSLLRRLPVTTYVYGDESGSLESAPFFALGVLVTKDPERHETQLNNLRRQHRYHNELKYSKTDRYQVPYAEAVIHYFLRDSDLRFNVLLVDNHKHNLSHFKKHKTDYDPRDVAYNWHYKKVLVRATPPRAELVVHLDDRQRRKEDNLPEYLAAELENLKSLQLVDSAKHQLVQVADLLTGCVYGEATKVDHRSKTAGIEALRQGLRVRSLLGRRLQDHDKFCVDQWKPPRRRGKK